MTDEIKGQAEHLSKLNDVRVAVLDLYKGKIGVDAEEASHVSLPTGSWCQAPASIQHTLHKCMMGEHDMGPRFETCLANRNTFLGGGIMW